MRELAVDPGDTGDDAIALDVFRSPRIIQKIDPKTGRVLATIPAFFADGSSLPTSLKILKFDTHGV